MTDKNLYYKAFGLIINSPIFLPELTQPSSEFREEDVRIQVGDLFAEWKEVEGESKYLHFEKEFCFFHVPDVAIFRIQSGDSIIVSPYPNVDFDKVRLFLLGTCMGILLMQRKILPLHGSAIAINGKAFAIVGESGAGKSTLAAAFLKRDYKLLSDDVIPVTISDGGIPIVTSAYPQQKLWKESLNQFEMEHTQFKSVFAREDKFAIPLTGEFSDGKLPLVGIIELIKTDTDQITMKPINSMERFSTLYNHTYRNQVISRLDLMKWHFDTSAQLANKVNIFQMQRPINRFTATELVDLILATVKENSVVQ